MVSILAPVYQSLAIGFYLVQIIRGFWNVCVCNKVIGGQNYWWEFFPVYQPYVYKFLRRYTLSISEQIMLLPFADKTSMDRVIVSQDSKFKTVSK